MREAYPDHTQFDPASEYHDPKASRDSPTWVMVDCRLVSAQRGALLPYVQEVVCPWDQRAPRRRAPRCAQAGPGSRLRLPGWA